MKNIGVQRNIVSGCNSKSLDVIRQMAGTYGMVQEQINTQIKYGKQQEEQEVKLNIERAGKTCK